MLEPPSNYPHRVVYSKPTPERPKFTIADLLVLTACSALGLAIARWMDPYSYQAGYRIDAEWVFFHGVVPALFGAFDIGHPLLLVVHFAMRRRQAKLSTVEYCGMIAIGTMVLCFLVEASGAGDRGDASAPFILLGIVVACLAILIAGVVAATFSLTQLARRDAFHWTDALGLGAAIVPATLVVIFLIDLLGEL